MMGTLILFIFMACCIAVLFNLNKIQYKVKKQKFYRDYEDIPDKKQYYKEIKFKTNINKWIFLFFQKMKRKMKLFYWEEDKKNPGYYQMRKHLERAIP